MLQIQADKNCHSVLLKLVRHSETKSIQKISYFAPVNSSRWRCNISANREPIHNSMKNGTDIEYEFPFGWGEIEGIHNRTDFDLSRHQESSGKSQLYFDDESKEKYIPYIIETSAGASRSFMAFLIDAYYEEEVNGELRGVLRFHPKLAPIKAAILPLVNKDGMPEYARNIETDLRKNFKVFFDDKGAVGRRYRRQDEA